MRRKEIDQNGKLQQLDFFKYAFSYRVDFETM